MESYLCCFPMNERGQVAYEIDKRRGRYTNICASDDSDTENDDVDHLANELAQKATIAAQRGESYADINEDSKEMVTINPGHGIEPFEQKRILDAISDCANGNKRAVKDYLETSSEAQLFIRGRDHDSKTTLISAASEPSSEMVSLLLKYGADVNAVDNGGRSALMEAALFGWAENVKVLLQNGADKHIRDSENRLAVDFARDYYKNRTERYRRTRGSVTSPLNPRLGYTEDTFRRDIDRQEIVRLLSGENRKSEIVFGTPPTLSLSESYSFTPSPMQGSLLLRGPIEEYPISSSSKTVARLERGGKFPSIGAMSGWSHSSVQSLRVDGRQWTDDVLYISEVVDHVLASHSCDQGKDGQYNACHAEKQLIAYFIDRHVFLPRDLELNSKLEERIDSVEDELHEFLSGTEIGHKEKLIGKHDEIKALNLELKSVETALNQLVASPQARPLLKLESQLNILNQQLDRHTGLMDMASAPPPVSLTEAVILVSSPPYQDCRVFKDKVNARFGLSIQLFAAL
ncbi:hypothetical protein BDV38DRAFT_292916 [Aspergillus pseudotamarii]|uniref:Single-strand DNA deaminase toxin A-like C-terminal domain-containing protein n=1 Tax=Aspergillus pseudotamarii TaxID=132259 RepID=A0A5N6SUQ2_ASPPS|nr:uncharacterized protein BDV38DRAFT_292916 [Aspergillus pseudotamarii]KAE8137470.1 hypothetical protein BDV38DRAFT_292916 [Aspergillus pseudotamarii]